MLYRGIKNLIKQLRQYPYNSFSGKFLALDFIILRLLPRAAFPNLSIVPIVKRAYGLDSDEEFKIRYYVSRVGALELWNSRPRNSQMLVEHFYQEHDMDIWRQAYYSKYNYDCKKKMLQTYHVLKKSVKKGESILDFGCGSGILFHYLRLRGFTSVDAADIPSRALDFILRRMPQFTHRIINLGSEMIPKDQYAAIVAIDCLEHTTEPLKIVQGLIESLRPCGILIIKFPIEDDFSYTHIQQAQAQRGATFDFLEKSCRTIVPEFVYRKI